MNMSRRFLVASSLACLIGRERDGRHVTEGYFPDQTGRSLHVRLEDGAGSLALVDTDVDASDEQVSKIPVAHAETLLEITAGQVGYDRIPLTIGTREVHLCRFNNPGPLDLITVDFASDADAGRFQPLPWFGTEVSADREYHNRSVALQGLPNVPEAALSDRAIHSLLDTLENRSASEQPQPRAPVATVRPQPAMAEDDSSDLGIEDHVIRELARSLRPVRK